MTKGRVSEVRTILSITLVPSIMLTNVDDQEAA